MTRPRKFTDEVLRQLRADQAQVEERVFRRGQEPSESELAHDKNIAVEMLRALGFRAERGRKLRADAASKLIYLFSEIRWEWNVRRKIHSDRSLPALGGIQPTHGQMRDTIEEGLLYARKLRQWYFGLPAALLSGETVPMTTPRRSDELAPELGVVIDRLADKLSELFAHHAATTKRGNPGERAAAQTAACWLIWFMDRHAADAPIEKRRAFLFCGMANLGIPCPSLEADPGDFNAWFDEVVALARSGPDTEEDKSAGSPDSDEELLRGIVVREIS